MRIDQGLALDQPEQVRAEATQYVQDYPESSKGWAVLGWAHADLDAFDAAQDCFDRSLELDPQWDNAHVGKGVVYRRQGDTANARKSYLDAIRITPENPEAFASLLVIELMEGNDEEAVEYGERAWRLNQSDPVIPANLSCAYHYLGDHAKRDEFYDHAQRLGYRSLDTLKGIFSGEITIR